MKELTEAILTIAAFLDFLKSEKVGKAKCRKRGINDHSLFGVSLGTNDRFHALLLPGSLLLQDNTTSAWST